MPIDVKRVPDQDLVDELISLYREQNYEIAEKLARQLIEEYPDAVVLYNLLGAAVEARGNIDQAIQIYTFGAEIEPDNVKILFNLALAWLAKGEAGKAADTFQKVLAIDPGHQGACEQYAQILIHQGASQQAISVLRTPVQSGVRSFGAMLLLGTAQIRTADYAGALKSLLEAEKLNPQSAEVLNALGTAHEALGDVAGAMDAFNRALALKPDSAEIHNNLGNLYKDTGDKEKSVAAYYRAIDLNPGLAEAHRHLSTAISYTENHPHLAQMQQLTQQRLRRDQVMHLSFALAKAYDDIGDRENSFAALSEANRLRRQTFAPDLQKTGGWFAQHKQLLSAIGAIELPEESSAGATPIFIVGMPRSGTTLVEQILAAHEQVSAGGERSALPDAIRRVLEQHNIPGDTDWSAEASPELLASIRAAYLDRLSDQSRAATFLTDKLPENYLWLPLIRLIFPDAPVIHCARNPFDTLYSVYRNYFDAHALPWAYDLEELVDYYNNYADMMAAWRSGFPESISHTVLYESLIQDQESETRKLLMACGLGWDENCLDFHRMRNAVRTASAFQVREPISSKSINSWQKYEEFLRPYFDKIALAPDHG